MTCRLIVVGTLMILVVLGGFNLPASPMRSSVRAVGHPAHLQTFNSLAIARSSTEG